MIIKKFINIYSFKITTTYTSSPTTNNIIVQDQVIPALGEQLIIHKPNNNLMNKNSKTYCN